MTYSKTWLTIANKALAILGNNLIENLSDGSPESNYINTLLPTSIEKIVSLYNWRCLRTRSQLVRVIDEPVFEYKYMFSLPSDFARLVHVHCESKWTREGNYILSNSECMEIIYIKLPYTPNEFTQEISNLIALQLAYDYANSTTSNANLKGQLFSELNIAIENAKKNDTQGEPDTGTFTLDYLGAR